MYVEGPGEVNFVAERGTRYLLRAWIYTVLWVLLFIVVPSWFAFGDWVRGGVYLLGALLVPRVKFLRPSYWRQPRDEEERWGP